MATQGTDSGFGAALRDALRAARMTQAGLAQVLSVDQAQVSRWINGKSFPQIGTLRQIEDALAVDLSSSLKENAGLDLYVSGPMAGVLADVYARQHEASRSVVRAARSHVQNVYWPAETIRGVEDFDAPDIGTEANLRKLHASTAFLYLQFEDVARPSSALVELGIALGMRKPTTILVRSGLEQPYMIGGFSGVAARLPFLPETRIYIVDDVDQAVRLVKRNGAHLFGLRSRRH